MTGVNIKPRISQILIDINSATRHTNATMYTHLMKFTFCKISMGKSSVEYDNNYPMLPTFSNPPRKVSVSLGKILPSKEFMYHPKQVRDAMLLIFNKQLQCVIFQK